MAHHEARRQDPSLTLGMTEARFGRSGPAHTRDQRRAGSTRTRYRRGAAGRSPMAGSVSSATSAVIITVTGVCLDAHAGGGGPATNTITPSAANCHTMTKPPGRSSANELCCVRHRPIRRTRRPTSALDATISLSEAVTSGGASATGSDAGTDRSGPQPASAMATRTDPARRRHAALSELTSGPATTSRRRAAWCRPAL